MQLIPFICNVVIIFIKKGNLINYSFLKFIKMISTSIVYEIITLFALQNRNSIEIKNSFQMK